MIKVYGKPNYQRFAETWMAILAAKEGLEIVPGSVKVTLKSGEQSGGLAQRDIALQGNCCAQQRGATAQLGTEEHSGGTAPNS